MKEKRQFRRKPISIDVSCDIRPESKGLETWTKDMSAGGICLVSREALDVDRIIDFTFTIPDTGKQIEVSGKVMWIEKSTVALDNFFYSGIQFMKIDERDRDLISKYVDGATFTGE